MSIDIGIDEIEIITISAPLKRATGLGYIRTITIERDGGQVLELTLYSGRKGTEDTLRIKKDVVE